MTGAVALTISLVVASANWTSTPGSSGTTLARARFPAATVAQSDGSLLFGERLTGRIRRVDASGRVDAQPVAAVDVSTGGQRGLLGLAVADDGRLFAAWTDSRMRLVVAQVAPGSERLVWDGPATSRRANGGRLAFGPDGRLVVGVGDLQMGSLADDPTAVNGKLLALDVDAGPDQTPMVVSGGWNNPFAFAFTPDGSLWVADNAPGKEPERLTRGDRKGPVTELPDETAPSGLAVDPDGRLLVCGYVSKRLLRYEINEGGRAERRAVLADDCRLGVVVLPDGRIVYAKEDRLVALES